MKIGFYSCMTGMPWGGSEELWWRAARHLQSAGHEVCVNYKWWPTVADQLKKIESAGGEVCLRNRPLGFWERKLGDAKKLFGGNNGRGIGHWLMQVKPDVVLVSLGYHPDRIEIAHHCNRLKIPYAINVQCASSACFIHQDGLDEYRKWYRNAAKVFFVSEENREKVETNLAIKLDNYEIVANPFNLDPQQVASWPEDDGVVRLACVGRIHFQSKGQDIIVEVMRQQKWRDRQIEVRFYGSDQGNLRQLQDLIELHGLENQLSINGFVKDINEIWSTNHALLLPSRYEGAPLVVVEAMLSNRIAVATDIGRNRELLDEGTTGFIADSATAKLLDDALERAWQVRDQWREFGILAGKHIRERYTLNPVGDFAFKITGIVNGKADDSTSQ